MNRGPWNNRGSRRMCYICCLDIKQLPIRFMALSSGVVPIPATPEMSTADQNRRGFVEAWLRSFGGVIAGGAEEMAERMEAAGYSSRRSLAGLFDETPQAIAKSFKVKPGVAYDLWS